jgi:CubicO group peptidase (beta-lactamase class C family)
MRRKPFTTKLLTFVLLFCLYPATAAPQNIHSSQKVASPVVRWRDAHLSKSKTRSWNAEPATLFELQRVYRTEGNWGGPLCPSATEMRTLVDTFLATPNPNFEGLGPTIPGTSISWSSPECGFFNYAAGLRNVENKKKLTPATLMGIASMTKPIIAAITLKLNDAGAFGPNGLDTPVDQLLRPNQIMDLTVGGNPLEPRCPGVTLLFNRDTFAVEFTSFSCPDFSRITLRNLMLANHGMYDFLNEVLLPNGNSQHADAVYFDALQLLGLNPLRPVSSASGYDQLNAYGLKASNTAEVGGTSAKDFEISFGNTGFQLLGIVLAERTGKSLDELIQTMIVEPLGIDPMRTYVDSVTQQSLVADNYDVYTGDPVIEQTGIYPITNLNGHTAVNTLNFGLGEPANINLAGGAGGLIANPKSYRAFLDAFVNGGLLSSAAQSDLNNSYIVIPDLSNSTVTVSNGFGILKIELRGNAGLGSVDIYQHPGSLPGILCQDAVVRTPASQKTLATGVICQNANFNSYPDQFELLLEFVNKFLEASDQNSQ